MVNKNAGTEKSGVPARRASAFRVNPWHELERWFDEFDRRGMVSPLARRWPDPGAIAFEGHVPKIDVLDREKEVVVRAELPGVSKDDMEVSVTDQTVTIKAHTRHEEKEEEGEYLHKEMSYGEYQRTLELPQPVDDAGAKARFTDGVLELTLPKLEKTTKRTVTVE